MSALITAPTPINRITSKSYCTQHREIDRIQTDERGMFIIHLSLSQLPFSLNELIITAIKFGACERIC